MRSLAPLLLAGCALAHGTGADAAAISKNVALVIENADRTNACDVATSRLRDSAAKALTTAGWTLDDAAKDYLYVNVSVIFQNKASGCAFNISVAVGRRLMTGYGGHVVAFTVRKASLDVAPVASVGPAILERVRDLVRQATDTAEQSSL